MTGQGVLGVIGGVGPVATTNIIDTIQQRTDVESEQDHLPILADIDSTLDSRVAAIKNGDDSVTRQLIENAISLEEAKATHLLIGSNTSHHYYDRIDERTDSHVFHMPRAVAAHCDTVGYDSVTVLGTDLLCDLYIYDKAFVQSDCTVQYPNDRVLVMDVIYTVKDGNMERAQRLFDTLLAEYDDAEPFVLACTELSMLDTDDYDVIDPVEVVADAILGEMDGVACDG